MDVKARVFPEFIVAADGRSLEKSEISKLSKKQRIRLQKARVESNLFECVVYGVSRVKSAELLKHLKLHVGEKSAEMLFLDSERHYTDERIAIFPDIYRLKCMYTNSVVPGKIGSSVFSTLSLMGKYLEDMPQAIGVRNYFLKEIGASDQTKRASIPSFFEKLKFIQEFVPRNLPLKPMQSAQIRIKIGVKVVTSLGVIVSIFQLVDPSTLKTLLQVSEEKTGSKHGSEFEGVLLSRVLELEGGFIVTFERNVGSREGISESGRLLRNLASRLSDFVTIAEIDVLRAEEKRNLSSA